MSEDLEQGGARFEVDRRITLQWLFGAIAASGVPLQGAYAAPPPPLWSEAAPPPVAGPGYGTDPAMFEGTVPWPKTLSVAQLATVAALCDTILPAEGAYPAPSALGIHDFIDEWVSAPYPEQQTDRTLLLGGFAWVEARARESHGKGYAQLSEAARSTILAEAGRSDARGAAFLERMKFLTTGAYYTSEAGVAELGYVGNIALEGDYPGPTAEALAHLDRTLSSMNLKRKQDRR